MEAFKRCIYNWLIFTYTEFVPVHYFIYLYFKEGLLLWGKQKSLLPGEVQSEVSPSTRAVCFLMFAPEAFLLWPQQHFYSNSELTTPAYGKFYKRSFVLKYGAYSTIVDCSIHTQIEYVKYLNDFTQILSFQIYVLCISWWFMYLQQVSYFCLILSSHKKSISNSSTRITEFCIFVSFAVNFCSIYIEVTLQKCV